MLGGRVDCAGWGVWRLWFWLVCWWLWLVLGERDYCFGEVPLLSLGFEGLLIARGGAG